MRLAVLTASPHRSYRKRFVPITPAVIGPELSPIRSSSPPCPPVYEAAIASRMSIASMAALVAWSSHGSGTTAAAM